MRWDYIENGKHSDWKRVFAWLPVKCDKKWVWLEFVYKRIHMTSAGQIRREYADLW